MKPFVIGVAGGSGSGKTTVVSQIVKSLGDDQVSLLEHDKYYRDRGDLRLEERAALNYDHPDSLETDLLVQHVKALRAGSAVEVPLYDFARHAREEGTTTVLPAPRHHRRRDPDLCRSRAAQADGRQGLRRCRR